MSLAATALLLFAACNKDDNNGDDNTSFLAGFDENGASISSFSVSSNSQVHFSRGNLQYQASTGTWRFSKHQYDYIGQGNANISSTYSGWIDLFGWGTSGWNSGAECYQPWSTGNGNMADFNVGGDCNNSLTGAYAYADWGVYNAISGGGNHSGMWRTLTSDEWEYLISSEGARDGKCGYGLIDSLYKGIILLPDSWQIPEGLSFVPLSNNEDSDNSSVANCYTAKEWVQMETAGAIFLPTAGRREADQYDYDGMVGGYWTSSTGAYSDYGFALIMRFDWLSIAPHIDGWGREYGTSVRLVRAN